MANGKRVRWGSISFIAGLLIAAIIAFMNIASPPSWSILAIAVLGLIVGLVNITEAEVGTFLVASIAFLISFQALSTVVTTLVLGWRSISTFLNLMSVFIAPAAAIVAIKAIFKLARD